MKICIVGPAHPYRGGLASIMEIMARTFASRGHDVGIKTFTVQYPSFLFPGKSQTVSAPPPADLHIERCVNTVDPFNWWRVGRAIRRERPDFVLMKYWTPFMAPCFGTIARLARGNGHTRTICQIDNVEPHEHHLVDRPFNRYFLSSIDGFIYMSEQVHEELKAYTSAPALFSPHPLFENFGAAVARDEACRRLGLDPAQRYALFFGLIRDYKGLDILLDAWARFRRPGHRLIVAGEFYASRERYVRQIEELHLGEEVILHDFFVPDADVKYYFSAADVLVQPYKTATMPRASPMPSSGSAKAIRSRGSARPCARRNGVFRGRRCATGSPSCTSRSADAFSPESEGRILYRMRPSLRKRKTISGYWPLRVRSLCGGLRL